MLAVQHPQGYDFIFNLDTSTAERHNAYRELRLCCVGALQEEVEDVQNADSISGTESVNTAAKASFVLYTFVYTPPAGSFCIGVNRMSTG